MGFLDDALALVDSGTKVAAKGMQKGAHLAGSALDDAGLRSAGRTVSGWGDDAADDAGLRVAERQLGQSDDPAELLHGDAKKLSEAADHLQKLHDAFETAGQGMARLDTDHWSGQAADNFRAQFDPQPKLWLTAADACAKAGSALASYGHTVSWAQDQAKDAVRIWKEAQKKTDAAAKSYMNDAMTYDLRAKAYNATPADQRQGDPPAKPGAFTAPAEAVAQFKEAEGKLDAARTQRDSAAITALTAITALAQAAPVLPSRTQILKAEILDETKIIPSTLLHFGGGVVKGASDLSRLARSLNPLDIYNVTHPAEYATGLSGFATGLASAVNHPSELVDGLIGSGWGSDPAEASGKLLGSVSALGATGGRGAVAMSDQEAAAVMAKQAAEQAAKEAAEKAAKEAAEKAAQEAAAQAAKEAGQKSAAQTAAVSGVDVSGLGDVTWRSSHEPLYRLDDRPPSEIKASGGLTPWNTHNTDLRGYVIHQDESAFVGATKDPSQMPDFRRKYMYEVDAPGGIDVNATVKDNPHKNEGEIAFPGGINLEHIKSWREFDPINQTWGPPVQNPAYHPPPGTPPVFGGGVKPPYPTGPVAPARP
ncbi:putative T7SS-secreted protein [Kitasatospora sp. NPDC127060]|uniref:putative T7SS-secreted protein n=1 Tax=Kitasatospora sp. NPDC127060 TaxID=3347121 RepID=UPI00364DE782